MTNFVKLTKIGGSGCSSGDHYFLSLATTAVKANLPLTNIALNIAILAIGAALGDIEISGSESKDEFLLIKLFW